MRLLLVSYQKSGTHQALNMFMHDVVNIVDRSGMPMKGLEEYGFIGERPLPRIDETIEELRTFEGKAFGHLACVPEYVAAIKSKATKVVFNIRDPRDIVVAEHENLKLHLAEGRPGLGHMNIRQMPGGGMMSDHPDPLHHLIILASLRWPNWLGWLDEDIILLRFEDLRYRTDETVERLINALPGCALASRTDMVSQAQDTGWSSTFRKGVAGEWKTTFTDEHKALSAKLLTPIIERLGYDA